MQSNLSASRNILFKHWLLHTKYVMEAKPSSSTFSQEIFGCLWGYMYNYIDIYYLFCNIHIYIFPRNHLPHFWKHQVLKQRTISSWTKKSIPIRATKKTTTTLITFHESSWLVNDGILIYNGSSPELGSCSSPNHTQTNRPAFFIAHPYVNAATPPDLHSTRRVCIDLQAKLLQPPGETKTAPPRKICVPGDSKWPLYLSLVFQIPCE